MDGRTRNTADLELITLHKNQGDKYYRERDYIAAVGQYSYAINYAALSTNPSIAMHELYLCRCKAYLNEQRYPHALCDFFTALVKNPPADALCDYYDTLRALYFSNQHSSQETANDTTFMQYLKTRLPDFHQALVENNILQEKPIVQPIQTVSVFTQPYNFALRFFGKVLPTNPPANIQTASAEQHVTHDRK